MSICEKRGHYYLLAERPPAQGAYWSVLVPQKEPFLYCRRCGEMKELTRYQQWHVDTAPVRPLSEGRLTLSTAMMSTLLYTYDMGVTGTATVPWLTLSSQNKHTSHDETQ